MNISKLLLVLATLLVSFSTSLKLIAGPHDHHNGKHHPPKESVEACKDKKSDDACSFESPHGKLEGKCFEHNKKPLHCKPTNPPAHHGEDHEQEDKGDKSTNK